MARPLHRNLADMTRAERFALFVKKASETCRNPGECERCMRMFTTLERLVLPKSDGEGRGGGNG